MRKRCLLFLLTLSMALTCLTGCGALSAMASEPDIAQVRNICELATLECYYHNVAKAQKEAGTSILNWGEKDRTFWIEYSGTVKLGIDMSRVKMKVKGDQVTITMPAAQVLAVTIDPESYTEDSFVANKDGFFNKNEITSEDATKAVKSATEDMEQIATENAALLVNAEDRAQKMIANYIDQLGDLTGKKYTITWEEIEH